MKIKQIASIAIIAALPFAANATQTIVETNTPAAVGANGTVNMAVATGPYQTATIGEHDDEHIATTAYVKGAYNDAIAAVNKITENVNEKQDMLYSSEEEEIEPFLRSIDSVSFDASMFVNGVLGGESSVSDIVDMLDEDEVNRRRLTSAGGVIAAVVAGADAFKNYADSKRVQIYTTWGNDTSAATTLVEFATAQQ